MFGLDGLAQLSEERSRAITAENPDGEVGAGGRAASELGEGRKGRPSIDIPSGESVTLADVDGPGVVRHIWITVGDGTVGRRHVLRDLTLRLYWDGEDTPSVEVPLGDFFCCGHGRHARVYSLPVTVAPAGGLNCYLPMPFEHARVTVESDHPEEVSGLFYQFDYGLLPELPERSARLHAQFRRSNPNPEGTDHTLLTAEGAGHYVGTHLSWGALERFWWGEGEVKFYLDGDEEYPTICGTGAEDYVGGAWAFGDAETYNSPFLGYPQYDNAEDRREGGVPKHGLYRWHVPDPVRFHEDLRATVQAIGHDGTGLFERADDVASVAYWYQTEPHAPFPDYPDAAARQPR
jgi:hypothetical protein